MPHEVVIVPHTHWDREWYETHDVFRLKLVHMLDRLLASMATEPRYRFTLDGQSAAIDDYLELRPQAREAVSALARRGQLALGPFLILLDEFLCDGEAIVRNLELGFRSAARLGPVMPVGYLPDMFGHSAQLPQFLRGFGIRHAAMWRGVPARVDVHGFAWAAPDGSVVRAEHLFDGYGSAMDLFAVPGRLGELAADYAERTTTWYRGDPVLGMLGTDHYAPPSDLLEIIDAAAGDVRFSVATLGEYLQQVAPDWHAGDETALAGLPRVDGELRSHSRGNLLPGVYSIRTNLKQAMADAERALTVAERLDAAFGVDDHQGFFDRGWYQLVESTAHDSVTGCGIDPTATEVAGRLEIAASVARGVTVRTLDRIAASVPAGTPVAINPAGFARRAHVELTLTDPASQQLGSGVQLLASLPEVLGDELMTSAELPKLLHRIHGRELFGQLINHWSFSADGLRFEVAESAIGQFDLAGFTAQLQTRIDADPDGQRRWRVQTIAAPRRTALVGVDVPGLALTPIELAQARSSDDPVEVGERRLANRQLVAEVAADGTVRIEAADGTVLDGALQLVDEGDRGDSYNFGPVASDSAVSSPDRVEVSVLETGPLRGRLLVRRHYTIPARLDQADPDRRSAELAGLAVDTVLELREGEPLLRVTMDLVNQACDHRLRVLVPAGPAGLPGSAAAGQYGVTERGRLGEGGWGEYPLPTYPAARFVHAGHTSLLLTKHSEYEVVTVGEQDLLALTLLRAVGMMSVNVHPLRDEPAGGEFPVPGAQYLGVGVRTAFAILPSATGWEAAGAARWSELLRVEPLVVLGRLGGPAVVGGVAGAGGAADGIELPGRPAIEVASDVVLESLRKVPAADGTTWEARFVNYRHQPQQLAASVAGRWDRTDLAGNLIEADVDLAWFSIGASRIETFRRRAL